MKPLFSSLRPKENAYPKIQYVRPQTDKHITYAGIKKTIEFVVFVPPKTISTTFFIIMLTSFFSDTHPDSNIPKPKIRLL